ncbi:MAG: AAA family ATPase [Bacteroidota bacterium]
MSALLPASQLADQPLDGLDLPGPYGALLGRGRVHPNMTALVWSEEGVGKSTLVLGLADTWARHVGPAIYVSAEEGHSPTMVEKTQRLGADAPGLYIATYDPEVGLSGIIEHVRETGASLVVIDSISWIDPASSAFGDMATMFRDAGIALVYIAHSLKNGTKYIGPSRLGHAVDAVVKVNRDGTAQTVKNRMAPLAEIDVPFSADDRGEARENPQSPRHRAMMARLTESGEKTWKPKKGSGKPSAKKPAKRAKKGQSPQKKAIMASLTESGKKTWKPGSKSKSTPKKTGKGQTSAQGNSSARTARPRPPSNSKARKTPRRGKAKPAPSRDTSSLSGQLAALQAQIANLKT